MGYLDNAGLQYLWGKLKEKFAPKSHSHDDRYYTESEMDGKLNSKVNNNEAGADSLLSKLTTSWTATPTDNTYFIRQDTGGGDSFGRVKFSTLWNYIKGKADGTYQPKGSYSTTDTKNTAGSTNTTSKLYLIGATSQSANPQTYSNASVYTTGSTIYANGFGNDIFIIYPSGGSASYGGQQIGYCKITLPTLWDSTMMTFTVTIYNYVSNTSVDYRISGYNYAGKPWYNCAAICVGKAGTSHSNLSVRFGDNGTKNVITIGEEDTEWEYPRIVVHDVVIGNSNFETYKSGWNVEISKSGAPNVSETISNTHVGYNAVTSWDKIQNKPSSFTPASHTHDDRYYTETEMNAKLDGKANAYHTHDMSTLTGNIINTEPSTNNHKIVLGKSGLDKCEFYEYGGIWNFYKMNSGEPNLVASIQSDGIHATLKGTADAANSVAWANVTGKPSTYTPATHTHDDRYYTEAEINNKLDGKSNTGHTHDDRYYTESEVNTKLANYQPKGNYAAASHTHNYAGSGSAGGSANSAIKLDSSAGSATQPVYFKDGKPVATTYALNKTVPADAKFTDTNTWRGIQNNLTSDSTDQSLSAAQGKALKTLVDGKAPASHKHTKSQITDFPTSMPASDVSAWAKAATKPSYTKAEVGLSNVDNTADKDKSVNYATSAGSASTGLNGVSTCIFDSSSNNGSCVRFYNGLQICFGNSSKSSGVVFKLPFANDNYAVVVGGSDTLKNAWYVAGSRTTTGFNPNQNGFAVLFHWIAIGNWK